jgi:hypothetical protein
VQKFVGGWVKLPVGERREAVKELAAGGRRHEEIADVLGVNRKTVDRDLRTNVPAVAPARKDPAPPPGQMSDDDLLPDDTHQPAEVRAPGEVPATGQGSKSADLHKAAAGIPETDRGFRSNVNSVISMLDMASVESNVPITAGKVTEARRLFDAMEECRQEWLPYMSRRPEEVR